jgi:hypothetical protein
MTPLCRLLHRARQRHHDKYMPFPFDSRKSVQALAFLLKQCPRRKCDRDKLLALLYLADRESLKETGHPITGDVFLAAPHGMTLEECQRRLGGSRHASFWGRIVRAIRRAVRRGVRP